jgi:ligand-binding sensor domain-containing protein
VARDHHDCRDRPDHQRSSVFALNPTLRISQYAHTAWRVREGFFGAAINSIAQTPDGYLWLGTEAGLYRFDGVTARPWQKITSTAQPLFTGAVKKVLVARDGTLWIGAEAGLASWKDGRVQTYPELAGRWVTSLVEDRDGAIWAAQWAFPPPGKVCAILKGHVSCHGEDGSIGYGALSMYEDRDGRIWTGGVAGLWQWKPGPPRFYPVPGAEGGIRHVTGDESGALLVSTSTAINRFLGGESKPFVLPGVNRRFRPQTMLRDRDGALWIGSYGQGLVHVRQGEPDFFTEADGLSGNNVFDVFEDREGNLWVSSTQGLDRFHELAVASFSTKEGVSFAAGAPVLTGRDGTVWFNTFNGVSSLKEGLLTAYGRRNPDDLATPPNRRVIVAGLPAKSAGNLFEDSRGRIWVSMREGFGYLDGDRFTMVAPLVGGLGGAFGEDPRGDIWLSAQDDGLFHVRANGDISRTPWKAFGRNDPGTAIAPDREGGGMWLGFYAGGVVYFENDRVVATYGAAEGLGAGRINDFRITADGTFWAATDGGLSRFHNGRFATLTSANGLPCDAVQWVIEDEAQSFLINMSCGLARIPRAEMNAWVSAADNGTPARLILHPTVLTAADGVRNASDASGMSPKVGRAPDGKIWFTTEDGLSVLDPKHIPFNDVPPPVHVEQVIADHQGYAVAAASGTPVRLPALTRDLQIDYTGLSLVAPEKVSFRYRLEGWDRDWQDVGARRQAYYNNLPPGDYRFHVIASNNSGVWNEMGATLAFAIAPAYYQTAWFRALMVASFISLVVAAYHLRLRQVAAHYNARLDARVAERTRIARDLHDTLLQSFQGCC